MIGLRQLSVGGPANKDRVPLDGIRFGIVTGIVSQKQWTWGPLIIDRLLDINAGEDVPEYYDTGNVIITRENVNNYRDE